MGASQAASRPRFSSRLTTLLTMAGLAIGLGNVWRFPYMMGQHGGSAFLFIYLLFMLLLAVPVLSAEWGLGRETRSGPVRSFQNAFGAGPGLAIGLFLLFGVFMALTYYSLVVGHVFFMAWHAATGGFGDSGIEQFQAGLGRHGVQYAFGLGVVAFSLWVVHAGLKKGIERANRLLVPFFGLAALYLVFVALRLDGAMGHLADFLRPDFSGVGPRVWFAAMGQACFSVGISGVLAVMYGSYLRDRDQIVSNATSTGFMDTGAALLASMFVVPSVLVFGIDMASGPGLMFNTLPHLFGAMPGGDWLAVVFLSGWGLVAILSIIATMDAIVGGLADLTPGRLSRSTWGVIVSLAICAIMLPIAFNPESIETLDMIFGSGMFMFGSLMAVIGFGWGLGKTVAAAQLRLGATPVFERMYLFWLRWVTPIAMGAILIGYILDTLSP